MLTYLSQLASEYTLFRILCLLFVVLISHFAIPIPFVFRSQQSCCSQRLMQSDHLFFYHFVKIILEHFKSTGNTYTALRQSVVIKFPRFVHCVEFMCKIAYYYLQQKMTKDTNDSFIHSMPWPV